MIHWKQEQLEAGKTFKTSEKGNSMVPLIKSGQEHILAPCNSTDVGLGDIVFCKVRGKYYTHKVIACKENGLVQIGNNKGGINGWTNQVYGKVIQIL